LARFCFFNKQISEKYGQKCCRYNQNGIPLPLAKVNETFSNLRDFLQGGRSGKADINWCGIFTLRTILWPLNIWRRW